MNDKPSFNSKFYLLLRSINVQTSIILNDKVHNSCINNSIYNIECVIDKLWLQLIPHLSIVINNRLIAIENNLIDKSILLDKTLVNIKRVDFNDLSYELRSLNNLTNIYLKLNCIDIKKSLQLSLYSDQINIYIEITLKKKPDINLIYEMIMVEIDKLFNNKMQV